MASFTGADRTGTVLHGRYRVEALLGQGGYGAVYRGTNLAMEQPIAIKFLHAAHGGDQTLVPRFQREARLSSRLKHPNTIRVFDSGQTDGGDLYMVMELLDGKPLSDWIVDGAPMAPQRVVRVGVQVCKSLAEAHELGLVHRDLKPDNLFLMDLPGEPDFVKVLDFGIAKAMDGDGETLTATGMVVGTPAYMSPEQIRKQKDPIDGRSDLYSLGVILYRLLTGQKLFDGTGVQVMMSHLTESPTPIHQLKEISDQVPVGLARVVMRLLEKDRNKRFPDALRAASALSESLGGQAVPLRPPTRTALARPSLPEPELESADTVLETSRPDVRRKKRNVAPWLSFGAAGLLMAGLAFAVLPGLQSGDQDKRKRPGNSDAADRMAINDEPVAPELTFDEVAGEEEPPPEAPRPEPQGPVVERRGPDIESDPQPPATPDTMTAQQRRNAILERVANPGFYGTKPLPGAEAGAAKVMKAHKPPKRAEKRVKLRVGLRGGRKTGGNGKLDGALVGKVFKRRAAAFRACYESRIKVNPNLSGKVVIRFTIATTGRISQIAVASNSTGDVAVGTCMVNKVKRWRFSPPDGGSVSFMYPIVLSKG